MSTVEEQSLEKQQPIERASPQIFALMRNGHEVIRGALSDAHAALARGDLDGFLALWNDMSRWMSCHAAMEDGVENRAIGMFALLQSKFPDLSFAHLKDAHEKLHFAEARLKAAIATKSLTDIKRKYAVFAGDYEQHLVSEEDVMMAKVVAMKKQGEDLKKIMAEHILPCVEESEMNFFLSFAMLMLEKHAEGRPRARVFAHAASTVATPDQWRAWHPIIKANLSPALYDRVSVECGWE